MAFKVQNINVDLMNGTANVIAIDQAIPPATMPKVVQVSFPFDPPNHEGREKDKAVAAAKAVLQQPANEIS
jgi:hypothetical protein